MAKDNGNGKKKNGKGEALTTVGEAARVTRSEPVDRKHYRLQLPCKIDIDIARDRGLELARVCRERQEFIDERKADNAAARERRAFFDERIAELRVQVEGKVETRSVEVVDRLLPDNEVEVVRLDTGEVIERRAAKPTELQESLLSLPAAKGDGKKGKKPDAAAPPPEPPFGGDTAPV